MSDQERITAVVTEYHPETAVAVPFAFLSEYVVDHPRFWQSFFNVVKKKAHDVERGFQDRHRDQ